MSVFPFDEVLLLQSNYNSLIRFARIGRLYRLARLSKIKKTVSKIRMKNKYFKKIYDFFQISEGMERLMIFLSLFLILSHIVSCLHVILANAL